jgi:hypothetical protein
MPPTLSQLQAWDTEHLINAANHWTTTADQWEDAFTQMRNEAQTIAWEGEGGDALRARTSGDLAIVTPKTDELRSAAQIARTGAGNISAAQRRALYAVEDAENEGFRVGEDLSVTDTPPVGQPQSRPLGKPRHKHSLVTSTNARRNY